GGPAGVGERLAGPLVRASGLFSRLGAHTDGAQFDRFLPPLLRSPGPGSAGSWFRRNWNDSGCDGAGGPGGGACRPRPAVRYRRGDRSAADGASRPVSCPGLSGPVPVRRGGRVRNLPEHLEATLGRGARLVPGALRLRPGVNVEFVSHLPVGVRYFR